jgi:hypothetical protein
MLNYTNYFFDNNRCVNENTLNQSAYMKTKKCINENTIY